MANPEAPVVDRTLEPSEAPNAIERFLNSEKFGAAVDSPYGPVRFLGLGAIVLGAEVAGLVEYIDEKVGTRDDERDMPFTYRLLARTVEKAESIEQPVLREVAENATSVMLDGYSAMEIAMVEIGDLATAALGNIQQ
jgi:hypothetical protein